jgi:hypothetical protein
MTPKMIWRKVRFGLTRHRPPWLISQQTLQSWPISRKLARTSTRRLDGHWTNTGLLVGFIHREREKEKKGPTKGFKAAA